MLRVYLDQNHWVSLMKVETGHPGGRPFRDVSVLLHEAVDRGFVSLPLSMTHAMELQNRANFDSRLRLAATMIKLSRWHAVAPQRLLLANEIDRALKVRFGRPAVPRRAQVFGVGANHLFGRPVVNYEPPEEYVLTTEQGRLVMGFASDVLQFVSLVGGPRDLQLPDYDPTAHQKVGRQFAGQQETMRKIRRQHGYHRGEPGDRAASVDVFDEFNVRITDALERAGLDWSYLYRLRQTGLEALIEDIPTIFAHRELRRLRQEASQRPWEENDLTDLTALPPAIVYCDVVVTERLWTDLAGRADLGQRFGTTVIRSLDQLVPFLLDAAAA